MPGHYGYENMYGVDRPIKNRRMRKRSVMLLIALIIAAGYVCLQMSVIIEGLSSIEPDAITIDEASIELGSALGSIILLPHVLIIAIGVVFNAVGWIGKFRWATLTSAILYTVGGVLSIIYFPFMLVPMILCYVVYGKSKQRES